MSDIELDVQIITELDINCHIRERPRRDRRRPPPSKHARWGTCWSAMAV